MSDVVTIALIAGVPATISAFSSLLNVILSVRHNTGSEERKAELESKIGEAKRAIEGVEKNTNGMMQAAQQLAFEAGREHARREQE